MVRFTNMSSPLWDDFVSCVTARIFNFCGLEMFADWQFDRYQGILDFPNSRGLIRPTRPNGSRYFNQVAQKLQTRVISDKKVMDLTPKVKQIVGSM